MLIEIQIKQNLNKIRSGDPLIFDNHLRFWNNFTHVS